MQTQTKPPPLTPEDAARYAVTRAGVAKRLKPAGTAAISQKLADRISDLAFEALDHPLAGELPYACRRILGEAAVGQPLTLAVARTVRRIAADLLAEGDERSDWGAL